MSNSRTSLTHNKPVCNSQGDDTQGVSFPLDRINGFLFPLLLLEQVSVVLCLSLRDIFSAFSFIVFFLSLGVAVFDREWIYAGTIQAVTVNLCQT